MPDGGATGGRTTGGTEVAGCSVCRRSAGVSWTVGCSSIGSVGESARADGASAALFFGSSLLIGYKLPVTR
jgi:hypothetical protein